MNKFRIFIILKTIILFSSSLLYGQAPEIEWQRGIGGKNNEQINDAVVLRDGSIIFCGTTWSCDGFIKDYHGDVDIYIGKIDKNGSIEWSRTLGGSGNDVARQIAIKNDVALVFCKSNSTDGDLSFKTVPYNLDFVYSLKTDGKTFGDFHNNYPNQSINSFTDDYHGNKLVYNLTDFKYYLFTSKSSKDLTGSSHEIFVKGCDLASSLFPGELDNSEISISAPKAGFFIGSDFIISNGSYLISGNTTSDEVLFHDPWHEQAIRLKEFHKGQASYTGVSLRSPTDAWIIKFEPNFDYKKMTKIKSLCLGGKGEDFVSKLFHGTNDIEHLIITSNSKDGDFSNNHGESDVWITDIDKDLNVKNKVNIGTTYNDKFLSAISLENGNLATLINSEKPLLIPKVIVSSNDEQQNKNTIKSMKQLEGTKLLQDDSPGLKLDIRNEGGNKFRLNFNFNDDQASLWGIGNNELIISANKRFEEDNDAVLICIDAISGTILWEKVLGGNDNDFILKVISSPEGGLFAVGTTFSNKTGNVTTTNGSSDFWIIKLNQKANFAKSNSIFNDNTLGVNNTTKSDDSSESLKMVQLKALALYESDSSNISALWKFAQTSEYLADYALAANAYSIIISKLDKVNTKSQISKARAHQITCKFLSQSDMKENRDPGANLNKSNIDYSGIGITTQVVGNSLMVLDVIPGLQADQSGIKNCDEIISINGTAVSNDCLTQAIIAEKLKGDKDSYVNLSIKRFGNINFLDFKLKRSEVDPPLNNSAQKTNTTEDNTDVARHEKLNSKQELKQNFLQKFVTSMEKDTSLMKNIEIARKVTYAITVLNKWGNEPVSSKYLLQIDEQLGMVSSLISALKGKSPNFNFDYNGKISFGNPELKELCTKDYAKEAQSKFDSVSHRQPLKETKIDDNVSFVENQRKSYSGYYKCIETHLNVKHENSVGFSCHEPDIWVDLTTHGGPPTKLKSSFVKVTITSSKITVESESETNVSAHSINTSNGGVSGEIISYESNIKTKSIASGDFNSSSTVFNLIDKIYISTIGGGGKQIYNGNVISNYPSNSGDKVNEQNIQIELLSNNQIKLSNEFGWVIFTKIKGL